MMSLMVAVGAYSGCGADAGLLAPAGAPENKREGDEEKAQAKKQKLSH